MLTANRKGELISQIKHKNQKKQAKPGEAGRSQVVAFSMRSMDSWNAWKN
jgi:hypothetical protein